MMIQAGEWLTVGTSSIAHHVAGANDLSVSFSCGPQPRRYRVSHATSRNAKCKTCALHLLTLKRAGASA